MSGSSGCTWGFVPAQGVMDSVPPFSLNQSGKRGEKLLKDDKKNLIHSLKQEEGYRKMNPVQCYPKNT